MLSLPLLLYFHICVIVVLEKYVTMVSAKHIAWGLKNGAYIHPSLGYYKNGMYAINGPVLSGEVLAKIPISLELKCEECSLEAFTYKFKEGLTDNSYFLWIFIIGCTIRTCIVIRYI